MEELIARLEKATGHDREIDRDIERTLLRGVFDPEFEGHPRPGSNIWPRYTRSIDDALSLVPGDLWWLIGRGQLRPTEPLYAAQIRKPGFSTGGEVVSDAEHGCMAIALCIAALRARAQVKATEQG